MRPAAVAEGPAAVADEACRGGRRGLLQCPSACRGGRQGQSRSCCGACRWPARWPTSPAAVADESCRGGRRSRPAALAEGLAA
eukprot:46960-Alexandrium_andersonii.AAC.1